MSFELHLPELNSTAFKDGSALVRFIQNYIDGPQKPCQRNEGPKMTWLCLAVAASRLPDVVQELARQASSIKAHIIPKPQQLDDVTKGSLRGVVGFLSTLPIWGYTTACNADAVTILDDLCPIFFSPTSKWEPLGVGDFFSNEYPLQFAFCLTLSSLQQISNEGSLRPANLPPITISSTGLLLVLVKRHYTGVSLGPPSFGSDYDKFQASWIGKQTHALLLALLIARNIYYVSEGGKANLLIRLLNFALTTGHTTVRPQLPNPSRMEFIGPWYFAPGMKGAKEEAWAGDASLRPRFPLLTPNLITFGSGKGRYFYPFSGDEWWSWYTTRVRDLTRNLDKGEWCGAYTYGLHLGGRMDPPMEKIRFRKTGADGETHYSVEALDGVDGIGTFTLRGKINASDLSCTIHLRKQYPTHAFDWEGLVTPLGICGSYFAANSRESNPLGFFWLWKREWMNSVVA
ncbi:hypothetical protein AAE478_002111 [Parahypoxylon ruwenzoriense]